MNTALISKIEESHIKTTLNFKVGDTIEVHNVIREGSKQRIQKFRGLVTAIKGSGTRLTFTVRKISYGIGLEKTFPLFSPNVAKVVVIKAGDVRRSKLYYMRDRIGKLAMKVKAGDPVVVEENPVVEVVAEEAELTAESEVEPVAAETETEAVAETATEAEVEAEVEQPAAEEK